MIGLLAFPRRFTLECLAVGVFWLEQCEAAVEDWWPGSPLVSGSEGEG